MDIKAIWFNSMQVKCAWEHELCANVCILDYDHQIQHKTYNIYIYHPLCPGRSFDDGDDLQGQLALLVMRSYYVSRILM